MQHDTDEVVMSTEQEMPSAATEEYGDAGASEAAPNRDDTAADGDHGDGGDVEPVSDWPELDAYGTSLAAENPGWNERINAVESQLASMRPALNVLTSHYQALSIEDDLTRLNETVLGGTAMLQSLRLGFNLERYIALFWPVSGDPRGGDPPEGNDAEYRIEIYLHLGPDGRGRIRVEAAKLLEAPLPTSRNRLRGVLLAAIKDPKLVSHEPEPSAAGDPGAAPAAEEPARSPAEQPASEAAPRPGDPDDQPPPEEQVIPLGPADASPDEGKSASA